MKKIMLLTAVLLILLTGCSQKEESVPTFIMIECNQEFLKDGVVTGTDCYTYTYNEAGLAIYGERHQDGSLVDTTFWEYDEFGNPVKITTEVNDTAEISEYKNTLDQDGRILRQEMYHNGMLTSVDVYTYDDKGNELTHEYNFFAEIEEMSDWRKYTKTYNRKGELTQQALHWNFNDEYIIWDYKDGLCVRQTSYESETDKIVEYWLNTYDEKGNEIKQSRYDEADNLQFYTEYTWDETGRIQTKMNYGADGTPRNHFDVFTYDEHGNQIMQERYRDGEVYWRISYVYEMLETAK